MLLVAVPPNMSNVPTFTCPRRQLFFFSKIRIRPTVWRFDFFLKKKENCWNAVLSWQSIFIDGRPIGPTHRLQTAPFRAQYLRPTRQGWQRGKYDIFIHVVFIFHLFTIGHFGEIFKLLDALLCQAASLIKHSWLVFHRSQVRKKTFDSSWSALSEIFWMRCDWRKRLAGNRPDNWGESWSESQLTQVIYFN